jgi:hypothetical protein
MAGWVLCFASLTVGHTWGRLTAKTCAQQSGVSRLFILTHVLCSLTSAYWMEKNRDAEAFKLQVSTQSAHKAFSLSTSRKYALQLVHSTQGRNASTFFHQSNHEITSSKEHWFLNLGVSGLEIFNCSSTVVTLSFTALLSTAHSPGIQLLSCSRISFGLRPHCGVWATQGQGAS